MMPDKGARRSCEMARRRPVWFSSGFGFCEEPFVWVASALRLTSREAATLTAVMAAAAPSAVHKPLPTLAGRSLCPNRSNRCLRMVHPFFLYYLKRFLSSSIISFLIAGRKTLGIKILLRSCSRQNAGAPFLKISFLSCACLSPWGTIWRQSVIRGERDG